MRLPILFLLCAISSVAICQSWTAPCGTAPVKSKWLEEYQRAPQMYDTKSADLMYVPLAINIVGREDYSGMIREAALYRAILTLNNDFKESDMQFFLRRPIDYIFNDEWADHPDVLVGADMMFANNIDAAINCYFVPFAAGNCGYNLPYAGVAVANNCAAESDHTWAHEIGHNLSLPHPFLGWEGNVDCQNPRWDGPSPTTLTYDYTYFQDTLIRDTLIIDTAMVELVDGSNCREAADGFCDTKPDYLPCRWACRTDGTSSVVQIDPNGEEFVSDGSLIMSYALDQCSSRFSEEQKGAMRANLIDQKPGHLLNTERPEDITEGSPTPVIPESDAEVFYDDILFEWEAVPNAMYYLLEVSIRDRFSSFQFDTIVSGTSAIGSLDNRPGRQYYWRVRPFTSHQFDYEYGPIDSFVLTDIPVDIEEVSQNDILIVSPTLISQGAALQLTAKAEMDVMIVSLHGQVVHQQVIQAGESYIDSNGWPAGMYLITGKIGSSTTTLKIMKQ